VTSHSVEAYGATPASRLTLLFGVRDRARHRSLMVEILQHARHARLAGATAYQAVEGFGSAGTLHSGHLLKDDTPLGIVIVDRPARVQHFLTQVEGLLHGVVAVLDDVEILDL